MQRRTRLSRGNTSRKNSRLDKLRQNVVLELHDEPNSSLKRYANVSDKELSGNPALGLLRTEAREVLAERQKSLQGWQSGQLTKEQKAEKGKSLIKKIVEGEQKIVGLVGKGFNEYLKLISGEKARELEEAIATVGMKPEEKKKTIEKLRKQTQEEMDEDFYPGKMPEHAKESKEFVEHRKQLDKDIEPAHAQEPKGVEQMREDYEAEDFSLGKVLPAEKPAKQVPERRDVSEDVKRDMKERGSANVTVNVNVGGQERKGMSEAGVKVDESVPGFLAQEKEATQREMDRPFKEESAYDVINEERAEMEAEQREVEKEKKRIFSGD